MKKKFPPQPPKFYKIVSPKSWILKDFKRGKSAAKTGVIYVILFTTL
jgi:hypothetical protein